MNNDKKTRGAHWERWLAENPETEVAASTVLTHREAEQRQDMMDNPRPRSPKFAEAMARHERRLNENTEAIQRSNAKELPGDASEKSAPEVAGAANADVAGVITPEAERDREKRRNRRVLGPGDWTDEDLEKLRSMKVPDEYAYLDAELEGWEPLAE